MSYIRSGSNPEALYVFKTFGGQVEFCGLPGENGEPHRMDESLYIPVHIFEGVMLRFLETREPVRCRGATLFWLGQAQLGLPELDFTKPTIHHPDLYKWRLMYPEKWGPDGVNAWQVTWCYIGQNIQRRR